MLKAGTWRVAYSVEKILKFLVTPKIKSHLKICKMQKKKLAFSDSGNFFPSFPQKFCYPIKSGFSS